MRHSVPYTIAFSAVLCIVLASLVSSGAVVLKERQEANQALFQRRNVLEAAGRIAPGQKVSPREVDHFFESAELVLVDLETGEESDAFDAAEYDQQRAKKDPELSSPAPENPSRIQRLPRYAKVYKFKGDDGKVDTVVLPIEGYGLWGTLYGYLALAADGRTVVGITFYDHKETPGLGGEVDNPRWKALWPGRKAYDEEGKPELHVVKGTVPGPAEAPYRVDGLSGATLTSRGVTNMLGFWLGPHGFGPYLEHLRERSA